MNKVRWVPASPQGREAKPTAHLMLDRDYNVEQQARAAGWVPFHSLKPLQQRLWTEGFRRAKRLENAGG